jgi:hypothetical protein
MLEQARPRSNVAATNNHGEACLSVRFTARSARAALRAGLGASAVLACGSAALSDDKAGAPDHMPRAQVAVAPYRYGDLTWENDRTAHRIYSRELEAAEPPSSSGVDAWGKGVRWPFMERELRAGRYHQNTGEGLDFYHVGQSRGVGGLGIWYDNKLWVSRNFRAYRVLKNGPDVASFEVDYAPWPVDVVRTVEETRRFTLPMGDNLTRVVSTIRSNKPDPLVVAIGIGKNGTAPGRSEAKLDAAHGVLTAWSAGTPAQGEMGLALRFDPAAYAGYVEDADNYLVLLKVTPGQPFAYYLGAAWSHGLDFKTRGDWEAYVADHAARFDSLGQPWGTQP